MSNTIKDTLTAIADAIRTKTGKTEKMKATDMPAEIASISAGTGGGKGKERELIEHTVTSYSSSEVTKIGYAAFGHSESLTSVDFPAATSIEEFAFEECHALTSVNFPAVTSIEQYAFDECHALTSIDLPEVTSIGDSVFYNCKALSSAKIGSKNPKVCTLRSSLTFHGTKIESKTGYIYVPDALVASYKAATNWSKYANQIKPLSEAPTT